MHAKLNNIRKQFANNLKNLEAKKPIKFNTPHIPVAIEQNETAFNDEWVPVDNGFEYAIQYGKHKLWLFVPLSELVLELEDLNSNDIYEQQTFISQHYNVFTLLQENFKETIGTTLETFLPITLKKAA